ncbi:MAG: hypothetical protein M0C28_19105 [Candidatus Moduliflexus flocculans]|nr:hypothetical protein [Candidatus Moduliflexus flocculans]
MKAILAGLFDGSHEGPHHVRDPLRDGPARLAHRQASACEITDSPLRRREHAAS